MQKKQDVLKLQLISIAVIASKLNYSLVLFLLYYFGDISIKNSWETPIPSLTILGFVLLFAAYFIVNKFEEKVYSIEVLRKKIQPDDIEKTRLKLLEYIKQNKIISFVIWEAPAIVGLTSLLFDFFAQVPAQTTLGSIYFTSFLFIVSTVASLLIFPTKSRIAEIEKKAQY